MRVINMNVNNSKINFTNLNLNLDECGVYMLVGENGVGKSSILKNVIFGKNEIAFLEESQRNLYNSDKSSLFAYVPQIIPTYQCDVEEYIIKGNKEVSICSLERYLEAFSLGHINMKEKINKLSGGEKVKLSIISALLKNTPYIFLDEPTNHLDNQSVVTLKSIIEKLSNDRTFIIVSHDERMKFDLSKEIVVKEGYIEVQTDNKNKKNQMICTSSRKNPFISFNKSSINFINVLSLYLIMFVILFFIFLNHTNFYTGYSYDNGIYNENVIIAYKAEYMYSTTNKIYANAENLNILPENYERVIMIDDIEKIANLEGVDKVITLNNFQMFTDPNIIETSENDSNVISAPHDYLYNYSNIMDFYLYYFGELIEGRYPYDFKNEIAISEKILMQDYEYNGNETREAIGQNIIFNNESYTIVGLLNKNSHLISFESDNNFGFYEYNPETYMQFLSEQTDDHVSETLIYTNEGQEKQVLNQLMQMFPAENFNSYQFTDSWEKEYNKNFIVKEILPLNIIITIFFGLIILIIRTKQISIDLIKIKDYINYYFDKKKIKGIYKRSLIIQSVLLMALSLFMNSIYSDFSYVSNVILFFNVSFLLIPSTIFCYLKLKNHVD